MAPTHAAKSKIKDPVLHSDRKARDLEPCTVDNSHYHMTNDQGVNIENTDNWLKCGSNERVGPHLLEDVSALQKIQRFDHERIPERVVHARGTGAFGTFRLYESAADVTKAPVLTDTSRETPVFVRFSEVQGSKGCADTVRDVRGFAVKFYTDEGNWDIVGNNIPVFFIQEAIKFPDMVHALKPEPHNEIPQGQTAHNNFWDFVIRHTEATHMFMWAMSDRAIPKSYRTMQGFSVNTFCLVNAEGKRHFVKFHFTPTAGVHSLVWDECMKLNGQDPDFHRRDLMDNIAAGNFPKWKFGLQLLPEEKEHDFDFDILDDTKWWPEELIPIRYIGELELNRNVDEFFTETEQVAFCTAHIVPGIEFSDDPLLQGRNFSYFDTQITRLGPNWEELPINRPICPVMNNNRDGAMRHKITRGTINYWPNRHNTVPPVPESKGGFVTFPERLQGIKTRSLSAKFKEHNKQAQIFYNSLSKIEQCHLAHALSFELNLCDDPLVYKPAVERLAEIDLGLAQAVALEVGAETPQAMTRPKESHKFLNVSQVEVNTNVVKDNLTTLRGRKIAILIGDGFDGDAFRQLKTAAEAVGAIPVVVGTKRQPIKAQNASGQQYEAVQPDFQYEARRSTLFDATFIPGGSHIKQLSTIGILRHWISETFGHCKALAATGEAVPWVQHVLRDVPQLQFASQGKSPVDCYGVTTATHLDDPANITDASIVAEAPNFLAKFLYNISQHRNWDRELDGLTASVPF
ncbi:catalase isozyme A [Ascosphaera apis ARSEF 7405]|uniref:Catalase n=1 Tax=Ascosphaera apis ARSEF 7405 TaxID=392613 RepID=A0A162ICC4_9EURO|nr:catalase isozyme A [Ascosphaera apis ARSEF 7405]